MADGTVPGLRALHENLSLHQAYEAGVTEGRKHEANIAQQNAATHEAYESGVIAGVAEGRMMMQGHYEAYYKVQAQVTQLQHHVEKFRSDNEWIRRQLCQSLQREEQVQKDNEEICKQLCQSQSNEALLTEELKMTRAAQISRTDSDLMKENERLRQEVSIVKALFKR